MCLWLLSFLSLIQEFLVCFKSQVKVAIYLSCLNYWGQVKLFLLIWLKLQEPRPRILGTSLCLMCVHLCSKLLTLYGVIWVYEHLKHLWHGPSGQFDLCILWLSKLLYDLTIDLTLLDLEFCMRVCKSLWGSAVLLISTQSTIFS